MLAIISSRYQYGPLLFFVVAEVMSNYLTTDGLKMFSLLSEAPLRPEVSGICHICDMVNPALTPYLPFLFPSPSIPLNTARGSGGAL